MRQKSLAIIGNGMATSQLLDDLIRRGARDRYSVRVFGEEKGGSYNRILLSRVLSGQQASEIVTKPVNWYEQNGIELEDGATVRTVDPSTKTIACADGKGFRYDLAVLATGSQPLVPAIQGLTDDRGELRDGAFVYRTMDDCVRMRAYAQPGDAAVVLGGGLLGLEAAKVLADLGLHVTVVHVAQTLMNTQLDPLGGEMLRRQIERLGIFVRTGCTVEAVIGETKVERIVLDDGKALPADLMVLACGVRPRVDVARASGLPVNRGIVVNDAMATEVPGIYAIGECSEHSGRTYGLVAPVWEQASVLADVLSGTNPPARYRGSKLYSRLKVGGVDVASMGALEPELESDSVVQVIEERRSAYRKLIVRGKRLVGAMLVGDTNAAAALIQAFDRGDSIPENPLEALCIGSSSASAAARERVICNCHKVTDTVIRKAVSSGASSVDAVGAATRAGTGCGSCKNEIADLLARPARATAAALPPA